MHAIWCTIRSTGPARARPDGDEIFLRSGWCSLAELYAHHACCADTGATTIDATVSSRVGLDRRGQAWTVGMQQLS